MKISVRCSLLWGCLAAASTFAAQAAPDDARKLELSFGLTRGTNSLYKGVLLQSRTEPLIGANYEHGRFFVNSQTGVGYKLFYTDALTIGVSANYLLGRSEASDTRYRGLGNVSGSLSAYGYFEWQPVKDVLTVYGNVAQSLRRSGGMLGSLGATVAFPLRPGVNAFLDYAVNVADARYMQAYYGVSASQSAGSGLGIYSPSAGRLSGTPSIGLQADLSDAWSLFASVGSIRLGASPAGSPMLQTRSQPSANLFLTYKYP